MKELKIPIYRAKRIDSDEYVTGYYYKQLESSYILEHEINKQKKEVSTWGNGWDFNQVLQKTQIDPTTLAIHFPDMLDSEGNKIFASLSEDGKGGDICVHPYDIEEDKIYPMLYKKSAIRRYFPFGKSFVVKEKFNEYKIIGIKQ